MFGGNDCSYTRAEAYYYTVSTNSWTQISNVPWGGSLDIISTIIKNKNGDRWLIISKERHTTMYYWNLETEHGWHGMGSNSIQHYKNSGMVSLTPYSAFILGGYTTQDSDDIQNFWVYNQENSRFEKVWRYIQNEHSWGYWTLANKNYRALENCKSERTYAAVGWGGTDRNVEWSVMLRKRWQKNNINRYPATCHRAIPDLSPGRWYNGITSLDYNLIICGGYNGRYIQSVSVSNFQLPSSDAGALSTCKTLDTNNEEAEWEDMDVSDILLNRL